MHPGLLLLLLLPPLGFATYRATRLIVKDSFPPIAGPRQWIERRTLGTHLEAVGDLVTCHFCASGWVSLALVAGLDWLTAWPVPLPLVMWLAVWGVGAMIAHLEPEK